MPFLVFLKSSGCLLSHGNLGVLSLLLLFHSLLLNLLLLLQSLLLGLLLSGLVGPVHVLLLLLPPEPVLPGGPVGSLSLILLPAFLPLLLSQGVLVPLVSVVGPPVLQFINVNVRLSRVGNICYQVVVKITRVNADSLIS